MAEPPEWTKRHRDILDLLALGKTNDEIARTLFLAEKTVRNYVSQILARIGAPNRTVAAIYWVEHRNPPEEQLSEELVELVTSAHDAGVARGLRHSLHESTVAAHVHEARQQGHAEGWLAAIENLRQAAPGQVAQ